MSKLLLEEAFGSSSRFGHDLITRLQRERFELFLGAHFMLWAAVGVVLPLWEYLWIYSSTWLLGFMALGTAQCTLLAFALGLSRRGRFELSITLVCAGTWVAALAVTAISPPLLPAMALLALVPVVFAEPYVAFRRGLAFTVIAAGVVLAMSAVARLLPVSVLVAEGPRWLETAVVVVATTVNALHIVIIVWNNAAALRTSEARLAERAVEVAASRARLIAAADGERRRIERDLHDGAQQHLVSLSVLLRLARQSSGAEHQALLIEASEVLDDAITEVRNLAHGIYPPLLLSGGLSQALPALVGRVLIPVTLDIAGVRRYPAPTEAALYYCCSEALQNAAKHGGPATSVRLTARDNREQLRLTISDTGRGFSVATAGAGLTNMRDRLAAIGGDLAIESTPEQGTRVTATVAITQQTGRA